MFSLTAANARSVTSTFLSLLAFVFIGTTALASADSNREPGDPSPESHGELTASLVADEDPVARHLDHLAEQMEIHVAAALGGESQSEAWRVLRNHYVLVEAELKRQGAADLLERLRWDLHRLLELERLAHDPEALGRHLRRQEGRNVGDRVDAKVMYGSISGRVTSTAGAPIGGVLINASNALYFEFAYTDGDGQYTLSVPFGSYSVAVDSSNFVNELFDDIPCDFDCSFPNGDPVVVSADSQPEDVDFVLEKLGVIRGRVLDAQTLAPLPDILVSAWGGSVLLHRYKNAYTDQDGFFELAGLEAGSYPVSAGGAGYQTEAFDDVVCRVDPYLGLVCDDGTPQELTVDVGVVMEDIDFELRERGTISGRVTDAATGEGLPLVTVRFQTPDGAFWANTMTDQTGRYQSPGLVSYPYRVHTDNLDFYIDEIYDNVPCRRGEIVLDCDESAATAVQVEIDAETAGIDFALDLGGSVSGTVRQSLDGTGIEQAIVAIYDDALELVFSVPTEADGTYEIKGLPAGSYRLTASSSHHRGEVYGGVACGQYGDCPLEDGDTVDVQLRQRRDGIDFELDRLGSIRAQVVNRVTREPIPRAYSRVYDAQDFSFEEGEPADDSGFFEIDQLFPGEYYLVAEDSLGPHLTGVYPGVSCSLINGCDLEAGETIEVGLNEVVDGLEIGLELGGSIRGTAVDSITGLPVSFGNVIVYDGFWNRLYSRRISGTGEYSINSLTTGDYYLIVESYPFIAQVYGGGNCDPFSSCNPRNGAPIAVQVGLETTQIDFQLDPMDCQGIGHDLCLGSSRRFRTVAKWRDRDGNEGYANFERLTSDSGYFWFFDSDNIEGIVKVLDACVEPFDRYWVFAAGLTDVDVTLWVTDLGRRQTRTYINPQGEAFVPIQDTDAFETCPAGMSSPAAGSRIEPRGFEPVIEGGAPKSCAAGSGRLCLSGGRFSVEAFYRTSGGEEQLAAAQYLTNDSGYFWFFDENNVEVLVKVLDACTLFERFWVFGAGLTNVEVRLVVTDTETGEVRQYVNTQGNAFQPIQDTQAFSTCF